MKLAHEWDADAQAAIREATKDREHFGWIGMRACGQRADTPDAAWVTFGDPVFTVRSYERFTVPERWEPGCDCDCPHCDEPDVLVPAREVWAVAKESHYCEMRPSYGPHERERLEFDRVELLSALGQAIAGDMGRLRAA